VVEALKWKNLVKKVNLEVQAMFLASTVAEKQHKSKTSYKVAQIVICFIDI
jgi:hypothetical protein